MLIVNSINKNMMLKINLGFYFIYFLFIKTNFLIQVIFLGKKFAHWLSFFVNLQFSKPAFKSSNKILKPTKKASH